jgi:hypothetical protein
VVERVFFGVFVGIFGLDFGLEEFGFGVDGIFEWFVGEDFFF